MKNLNEASNDDLIMYAKENMLEAVNRVYEAQRRIVIYANKTSRSDNPLVTMDAGMAYAMNKQCDIALHMLKSMFNQIENLNKP